jgi:hypothetical protein
MARAATARKPAIPFENRGPGIRLPKPKFVESNNLTEPFQRRFSQLTSDWTPFRDEWQGILELTRPRRGKFMILDKQQTRLHGKILNNTATIASRTCSAGMMSGVSSPARPWFRITTDDPDLSEFSSVKSWLMTTARRMSTVFARSNVYNMLATIYGDLGDIGNGCNLLEEDFEDVVRATLFPPGQFRFAVNGRGTVDTVYREFPRTVIQLVDLYGDDVSKHVRAMYDQGNYDAIVMCVQAIEPNMKQVRNSYGVEGKPFISAIFERDGDRDECLEMKGYNEWPLQAPRWDVMAGDVYGNGPGLDAFGDNKALQRLERRKAQAGDKLVTPPVQAPTAARRTMTHVPGGVVFNDATTPGGVIRPLYEQNPQGIRFLSEEIMQHERRINTAYYADLFLMLAQSDRREITAREIEERHEEKLLALGPVLERLHDELLSPLIARTYAIMDRAGLIPEPPQELQNVPVKIEYISLLAQAQRAVSTGATEKFFGFVGNLAAGKPDVLDKVDFDQALDVYGDNIGIDPSIIVGDEEVRKTRAARAQQQAAQAAAAAAPAALQGAQAAKVLSETDLGADSALSRILDSGGFSAGGAVQ